MASRIIYLPFDHLHRGYGALKNADPKTDVIAMVESARMTTGRAWHPMRLFFLISSARHFAESLRNEGFVASQLVERGISIKKIVCRRLRIMSGQSIWNIHAMLLMTKLQKN